MNQILKEEESVSHPIDRVWDAITKESEVNGWFLQGAFHPAKGARYQFHGTANGNWDGFIRGIFKEVTPQNRVIFSFETNELKASTEVTWTLTEELGGTHIAIEHCGPDIVSNDATIVQALKDSWSSALMHLSQHLEDT